MGQKNSKISDKQAILENEWVVSVDMLINIPSGIVFKNLKFNRKNFGFK